MITPNEARRVLRGGVRTDAEIAEAIRALKHSTFYDDMELIDEAALRLADAHYAGLRNGDLVRKRQREMRTDALATVSLIGAAALLSAAVMVILLAPDLAQAWLGVPVMMEMAP
jgi:cellobiose-specific phosphotransferase system component IIA